MVEYRPHTIITDLLKHYPYALDNEGRITVSTGAELGVELNDELRKLHSDDRSPALLAFYTR